MPAAVALIVFVAALVLTLGASELLVRGLTSLGVKLGLTAGMVGLLTALGADAPEISSALSALLSGAHEVGVGVALGSNLFNLAALLGLPALVYARLRVRAHGAVLNGVPSLALTALAAIVASRLLGPVVVLVAAAFLLAIYIVLISRHGEVHETDTGRHSWTRALISVPATLVIAGGSLAMVTAALSLERRWHVPPRITGTLVLAALTSLPNAYAALRLAQLRLAETLVSEAFNSNSINLAFGILTPAAILGTPTLGHVSAGELAWLLALSVLAIALPATRGAFTRASGVVLVVGYAGFVALLVAGRVG